MRRFFVTVCCFVLICLGNSIALQAKITLPVIFSDGMVLQQQSTVALWGSTDKKQQKLTITPSWGSKSYTTQSNVEGKWRLLVETPSYGGPYTVTLNDGDDAVQLRNVMIGEVWLCSGQSNMNMTMEGSYNDPVLGALDAVVTAENPAIRMFMMAGKLVGEPQTGCVGSWKEASSESVPHFSATAYYFARKLHQVLQIPVGIICAAYGGSRVEAWTSAEGIAPYKGNPGVHNECILYNGMIHPIAGYGIRGCLWYQGEANMDEPDLYIDLFPAMVADWRRHWNIGDFPFYYAQITPFNYNKGEGKGRNSAYLREAQLKCLDLIPASGMITLMDVGDNRTIHPMEKEAVGNRFAYMALGRTYEKKGFPTTGPLYKSMQIEGDKVTLFFDEMGRGLTSYRLPVNDVEVAGEDKVFYPATVRFGKDMKSLIVSSPQVARPVAVRYAFKDYVKGTLFNLYGLPASSFRTDNW